MVNTQLLDEAIDASGKTKKHLAGKLGMSVQTFRLKRLNQSAFDMDDVEILCNELNIKGLARRKQIFLVPKS